MKRFIVASLASLAVVAVAQDRQTGHPQNQPNQQQPNQPQQRDRDTDRARIETKTAAEVQQVVNQATITLDSAMRTAERSAPNGAKMVGVAFCTWEDVNKGLNRDGSFSKDKTTTDNRPTDNQKNPQDTQKNAQNLSNNHPVVKACFVGDNRFTEVVICGKTGQLIGTKELSSIQVARAD